MLDFQAYRDKKVTFQGLVDDKTVADLRDLNNEMVDKILELIANATDADVVFVPQDPDANDTFASNDGDVDLAWTLGHVVVHSTASSEEAAALAAEMARGVELHGRSRSEIPWETVTTVDQCRERLEESRRMVNGSLDMWPDNPYYDIKFTAWASIGDVDARGRFALGLAHAASHLGQVAEIMRQAKAARGA
ncbi:MAG: DinB family protein [Chloroflexota bacterium]